jgi:hypothetical protein
MKWKSRRPAREADVCIILEGAYPFIAGGVSSWTHDLIRANSDLTFHLSRSPRTAARRSCASTCRPTSSA